MKPPPPGFWRYQGNHGYTCPVWTKIESDYFAVAQDSLDGFVMEFTAALIDPCAKYCAILKQLTVAAARNDGAELIRTGLPKTIDIIF